MLSVLQRLMITENSTQRLVLRELPMMEWLAALVLFNIGVSLTLVAPLWSAGVATALGLVFALTSRVRYVVFDRAAENMIVFHRDLLGRRQINAVALDDIVSARLYEGDDGGTQVLLMTHDAQHGLSLYSRGGEDWKEAAVIAINQFIKTDDDDPLPEPEPEWDVIL